MERLLSERINAFAQIMHNFATRIRLGVAAMVNGRDVVAMYQAPSGVDSNGSGEVLERHPLRGTIVVRDFRSGKEFELPANEVGSPQSV